MRPVAMPTATMHFVVTNGRLRPATAATAPRRGAAEHPAPETNACHNS
jgi:hypothetical protein